MYNETFLSIAKIENGFLIEVRVPYKSQTGADSPMPSSEEKQFFVKDAEEVGKKVADLLPKLADKIDADEEFANTFEEIQDD